jgi:DNA-binding transcriptional ArsR family regulator
LLCGDVKESRNDISCPHFKFIALLNFLLRIPSGSIYSHMAMHHSPHFDLTFHALADGTRRSMIHALARGEARSAGELGRQFRSTQPTISKHLKVLEQAGIVERNVKGRVHQFQLRRKALEQAGRWIARHQAFWEGAVDQLDRLLAEGAER